MRVVKPEKKAEKKLQEKFKKAKVQVPVGGDDSAAGRELRRGLKRAGSNVKPSEARKLAKEVRKKMK